MDQVKISIDSNILTAAICGHLDSANAQSTDAAISDAIMTYSPENIIVDCADMDYISSAGLRVLLKLKKAYDDIEVINVKSEVYEIFSMTGFTEIMNVSKAFRELSVDGCTCIGRGAKGKVYRYDRDTIIKVYVDPDSLPDIKKERELARKAFVLGIPTAISFDVVKVGDSYGSIFELLDTSSFAEIIAADSGRIEEIVGMYVDLLRKIHSTEVYTDDIPSAKDKVLNWVDSIKEQLSGDQYGKLDRLIRSIPDRHTMIHGDYHLKNVMLQDGEALLIDMDTLSWGHPVFEIGTSYLAYLGYSELDHNVVKDFLGIPYDTSLEVWNKFLKGYFNTEDTEYINECCDKAKVISYVRMIRHIIRKMPDNTELLEHTKERLTCLLAKIESLEF